MWRAQGIGRDIGMHASGIPPARVFREAIMRRRTVAAFGLALSLAWLGWRVYRSAQQAKAVAQIQAAGGFVVYDYQGKRALEPQGWPLARKVLGDHYFVTPRAVHLSGQQLKVQNIEQLVPYLNSLNLVSLYIDDTRLGDPIAEPLSTALCGSCVPGKKYCGQPHQCGAVCFFGPDRRPAKSAVTLNKCKSQESKKPNEGML